MYLSMNDPMQNLDALIARLKWEKNDRRRDTRLKAARRLRITYPGCTKAVFGMLIDLSRSGARLRPIGSKDLPSEFSLELQPNLIVPCKIVHQYDGHIGVKFRKRSERNQKSMW